jgi:hypothetical protein
MAEGKAWLPPRWFIKTFWHVHRWILRASRGRTGLWAPRPGKWGALRLTTTGRRSGEQRSVILGCYEDGPNLVSMAMNGWGAHASGIPPAEASRDGRSETAHAHLPADIPSTSVQLGAPPPRSGGAGPRISTP